MPAISAIPASAFAQIGQIASRRPVHAALAWVHLHEQQIMRWQAGCVAVPAPPFAESARAAWLQARFVELGMDGVTLDEAGNVYGCLPDRPPSLSGQADEDRTNHHDQQHLHRPVILLSAHLDTVFPAGTLIAPQLDGHRLQAPGACDNGAGLAALLATAAALRHASISPGCRVIFLANTGEEGEGDLRGMRNIYATAPWRMHIAAHLVLDGAGHSVAVVSALGSRRFEVEITGPGGHSWTDAGRPNPIVALSDAITRLHQHHQTLSMSQSPTKSRSADATQTPARSTWSVGTIEGGSAVNALPARAVARFDLRSTAADSLTSLEVALHRAIEDAVLSANGKIPAELGLRFSIRSIGDRPTGTLPAASRMLALLRAVDRHLGLRTELRTASTDANIPLSLGVEAISIGAGGEGGGIHTTAEWFDARGRDLGLRRILLLLLALVDSARQGLPPNHAAPGFAPDTDPAPDAAKLGA